MIIRRSRCFLLLGFLVVVHLLIYVYIGRNPVQDYGKLLSTPSVDFFKAVESKFYLLVSQPDNTVVAELLYNVNFDNEKDQLVVVPEQYFVDDAAPAFMAYNPHLTMSILLNHLTEELDGSDISDLSIPYFHWSDYVNMTLLHPYMVNKVKPNCEFLSVTLNNKLRDKKNNILEVDQFCFDESNKREYDFDSLFPPIDRERLLKVMKDNEYSSGFHIFRNGATSTSDFKKLHSRAYLNEFMPTPLSLVFILPPKSNSIGGVGQLGNAIQLEVNQNINGFKPLFKTELLKKMKSDSVNSDVKIDPKMYMKGFMDKLDTKPEFQSLLEQNSKIPYEKHLTHEQFVDDSLKVKLELDKQFAEQKVTDLHLINYKNGLDTALGSPYPLKYFYEAEMVKKEKNSALGQHYDWRFFDGLINYTELQAPVLHGLIRAWFQLVNNYKFNTWIAHGTLLSWFWNGVAFPWDIDFDVQMPIKDLHGLCRQLNQSLTIDLGSTEGEGLRHGKYFLDCGTFIGVRDNSNGNNNIDARFIDVENGLYIDITGLALTETPTPRRYNPVLPPDLKLRRKGVNPLQRNEYLKVYNCKNNHFQTLENLTPLRLTQYEGQLNYVPHGFKSSLANEYGESSISNMRYKTFSFIEKYQMWIFNKVLLKFIRNTHKLSSGTLGKYRTGRDTDGTIEQEFKTENDYLDFLLQNQELLAEYLVIHEISQHHLKEMSMINEGTSTKSLYFQRDQLISKNRALRPSLFNYNSFIHNYDFLANNAQLLHYIENGGLFIEQPDRIIDTQEAIPQPVNDVLEELQVINEPQTSGVAPEGVRHSRPIQIPAAAADNEKNSQILPKVQLQTPDQLTDDSIHRN